MRLRPARLRLPFFALTRVRSRPGIGAETESSRQRVKVPRSSNPHRDEPRLLNAMRAAWRSNGDFGSFAGQQTAMLALQRLISDTFCWRKPPRWSNCDEMRNIPLASVRTGVNES